MNKRIFSLALVVIVILGFTLVTFADNSNIVSIMFNMKDYRRYATPSINPVKLSHAATMIPFRFSDAKPYINSDGRVMIPLRALSENLGLEVNWNSEDRSVSVFNSTYEHNHNGKLPLIIGTVKLKIGEKSIKSDFKTSKTIIMDTVPTIYNNRVYIPLRYVANAFDLTIEWDPNKAEVLVSDNDHRFLFYYPTEVAGYTIMADIFTSSSAGNLERYRTKYFSIEAEQGCYPSIVFELTADNERNAKILTEFENIIKSKYKDINFSDVTNFIESTKNKSDAAELIVAKSDKSVEAIIYYRGNNNGYNIGAWGIEERYPTTLINNLN